MDLNKITDFSFGKTELIPIMANITSDGPFNNEPSSLKKLFFFFELLEGAILCNFLKFKMKKTLGDEIENKKISRYLLVGKQIAKAYDCSSNP